MGGWNPEIDGLRKETAGGFVAQGRNIHFLVLSGLVGCEPTPKSCLMGLHAAWRCVFFGMVVPLCVRLRCEISTSLQEHLGGRFYPRCPALADPQGVVDGPSGLPLGRRPGPTWVSLAGRLASAPRAPAGQSLAWNTPELSPHGW